MADSDSRPHYPQVFLYLAAGWFLVGAFTKAIVAAKYATTPDTAVGQWGKASPDAGGTTNGDPDYYKVFSAASINGSAWGAEFEPDGSLLCDDTNGEQRLVHCQNYGCDQFVCFCDILQRPIRDCQHYCCCDIDPADHQPLCVESGHVFVEELADYKNFGSGQNDNLLRRTWQFRRQVIPMETLDLLLEALGCLCALPGWLVANYQLIAERRGRRRLHQGGGRRRTLADSFQTAFLVFGLLGLLLPVVEILITVGPVQTALWIEKNFELTGDDYRALELSLRLTKGYG